MRAQTGSAATKEIAMDGGSVIRIREPIANDDAFLHHGFLELAWEDRTPDTAPDPRQADRLYAIAHEDPSTRVLVAADSHERVLGYVAAREKRFMTKPWPLAFILEIFVEPENRGHGIGQQLLKSIEDWAIEGGYRQLAVTLNARHRARHLYERLGYKIDRFLMVKGVGRPPMAADPPIRFRAPEPDDTPSILQAKREIAWSGLSEDERETTGKEAFLAQVAPPEPPLWRHEKYFAYVATDEAGEFLGYAMWTEQPSPLHHGPLLCLYEVFVDPAHRGKGVGRNLLLEGERRAREHGYGMMGLMVSVRNPALKLYEAYGFVADRLLLTKTLPSG